VQAEGSTPLASRLRPVALGSGRLRLAGQTPPEPLIFELKRGAKSARHSLLEYKTTGRRRACVVRSVSRLAAQSLASGDPLPCFTSTSLFQNHIPIATTSASHRVPTIVCPDTTLARTRRPLILSLGVSPRFSASLRKNAPAGSNAISKAVRAELFFVDTFLMRNKSPRLELTPPALSGLLGLRPFEAYHAHWSGVKWETSESRVEAEWFQDSSKPGSPDTNRMLGNASRLPMMYEKETITFCRITTHSPVRVWRELNHGMAFWRGKQDILRHSYGTHRRAIVRNAHQVAEEMRNSVGIVRRHCDSVLEPSKAKA
jgi:hypothetical protein